MRFLLIIFAALSILGCKDTTDDAAIIKQMCLDAVEMAERHKVGDLVDLTTKDFKAYPGTRNRTDAKRILLISFKRYGKFKVRHPEFAVKLNESKTTAEVTIPFLIVREGENEPDFSEAKDAESWLQVVTAAVGDPYRLNLGFTKKEGDWKIWKATIDGIKRYDSL